MNILEEEGVRLEEKLLPNKAASAAAIAKILSGIQFPKKKEEVVVYARKNKSRLDNPEEVLGTINELPNRTYHTIVEVEKALGEIR